MFRKHGYLFLLILLFAVGAFLRLYNFENRLIFGPEQGMSFITSAENLDKFSLLGETNWIRSTSSGHIPFHGAFYSYFILPLLVLFKFKVLPVTVAFVFLNLITALVFFIVTKRIFGKIIGIFSLFFFLFSDVMIHHSLFAWIVNPSILLGALTLWFVYKLIRNRKSLSPMLWIGVLSGLGFGFQSFYLLFAGLLFLLILFLSKKKVLSVPIFLIGVILGSLPTVIFDLRHDFYHVRTFWQFFLDVLAGQSSGTSSYYNFLFLYPYLFLIYAFITKAIYKFYKPLTIIPIALFLYVSFTSPLFNLNKSTGMVQGITLKVLETAALEIAYDNPPEKFNIVTLWDFDTRAHTLRFLLTYNHNKKPQPVEEYKNLDAIYAFAPENYEVINPEVWELQSFLPYKISELRSPSAGFRLYKLTK